MDIFSQQEKACDSIGYAGQALAPIDRTIRTRLENEKQHLSSRICEINEALGLLERNPDIERLMNILR